MNVCVIGLWHLGTVTAACLAAAGHHVVGLDFDPVRIADLAQGKPPLFEPGLAELVSAGLNTGALRFTTDPADALRGANVVWVAYDTPVDQDDRADVQYVVDAVTQLFAFMESDTLVLVSSQLPVGTTAQFEKTYAATCPNLQAHFGYSPENLRLGKAIAVFTQPDRIVVGVRSETARERVRMLLAPFTENIVWMSVESAEMTKHALNAFLAVSVTFINEIAALCEQVGADAKQVEQGLKSEVRIGPKAYLAPGGAFAGGTLARDIVFLESLGAEHHLATPLIAAVKVSNDAHKRWAIRRLQELLGDLRDKKIAVWGLTYKPGTNTLRRSGAIELCVELKAQGAHISAHDPSLQELPREVAAQINLMQSPLDAVRQADALVIATEWNDYRGVRADDVVTLMRTPLVLDANRFLAQTFGNDKRLRYLAVGTAE